MKVGGAWKARGTGAYVDLPQPLPVVDQAHAQNTPGDSTLGAWGAPSVATVDPEAATYLYEQVEWVAQDYGGLVLDVTPADHAEGYAGRAYPDQFTNPGSAAAPGDVAYQQASGAAHGRDFGGDRAATYGAPPFQAADERYISSRFEGVGPISINPQVLTRGLNGLAENNPDGFRPGYVDQWWEDRKIYVGERVHDFRLLTPNSPFVDTDTPTPDDPGPYNSPFAAMARMISSVNQTPMMRREAPPVDQDIITDGTGGVYSDPYASGADWVAG